MNAACAATTAVERKTSDRTTRLELPPEVTVVKIPIEGSAARNGNDCDAETGNETIIGFVDSPLTGSRLFRMVITVPDGYDVDNEVTVETGRDGRSLSVSGIHRMAVSQVDVDDKQQQQMQTSEFRRQIKLPSNVDAHSFSCRRMVGGPRNNRLVIDVPVKAKTASVRNTTLTTQQQQQQQQEQGGNRPTKDAPFDSGNGGQRPQLNGEETSDEPRRRSFGNEAVESTTAGGHQTSSAVCRRRRHTCRFQDSSATNIRLTCR
jgi:hypothetical protein